MDQNNDNKIYNVNHNNKTIPEIVEQVTLLCPMYICIRNISNYEEIKICMASLNENYKLLDFNGSTLELIKKNITNNNMHVIHETADKQYLKLNNGNDDIFRIPVKREYKIFETETNFKDIDIKEIEQGCPMILYTENNPNGNGYDDIYDIFKVTYLGKGFYNLHISIIDEKPLVKCARRVNSDINK